MIRFSVAAVAAIALLTGCSKPDGEPANQADITDGVNANLANADITDVPDESVADGPAAADWVGRWTGVGTATLDIGKGSAPDSFTVSIAGANGGHFAGIVDGDTIRFKRGGKVETLSEGDGSDTGVAALANKGDCLVVAPGEAWCRQ